MNEEARLLMDYIKSGKLIQRDTAQKIIICLNSEELSSEIRSELVNGLKQYIDVNGKNVSFGQQYIIVGLIDSFDKDGKYSRECVENKEFNDEIREMLACSQDEEYIIEGLKKGIFDFFPNFSFGADFIEKIGEDKIRELLEDEQVNIETKFKLAASIYGKSEKNIYYKSIKNVSELSVQELKELPNVVRVEMRDWEVNNDPSFFYNRDEYIAIRTAIDEIIDGIEKPEKDDFKSEFDAFKEIYKRLANYLEYDYEAKKEIEKQYRGERSNAEKIENSQNLYGLIEKQDGRRKTVCAGYSRILLNTLSCMGIECKYIRGNPNVGLGHAWNQVKIGGQWFNVDLTWDRDDIIRNDGEVDLRVLKTDKEFKEYDKYSRRKT